MKALSCPFRGVAVLIAAVLISFPAPAAAEEVLKVGSFSDAAPSQGLPEGWEHLTFKDIDRYTRYRIVDQNNVSVVEARSDNSASGLIRRIRIDPLKYPIISWKWKISNVYDKGDITRKSGDDYPARIYIAFEYDPEKVGFFEKAWFTAIRLFYGEYPPIAAINYIWASRAPVGTIAPNPFTGRVKMIVLESGESRQGLWVEETRNIRDDYREAFGGEPPAISGIAIMTDSDNTGESAVSFYGDITMRTGK